MVYGVTLIDNMSTAETAGMIFFANRDLVDDFMEWVKSRYTFINEYHNEKAEAVGMKNFMFYYTSNPFMLSIAPIACKDYKGQSILYKVIFKDNTDKLLGTDMYTDKTVAESIANTINNNSDAIICNIEDCVVVDTKESLEGFKKFLITSNTFQEQWTYYSRIAF